MLVQHHSFANFPDYREKMAVVYDRVVQWLDWGDHTVTVDPIGNSAWIQEGRPEHHQETVERGRAHVAADTKALLSLLQNQETKSTSYFLPSAADLELKPKFLKHAESDMWKGKVRDVRGTGQLPVVMQLHRAGLPDVPKAQIEREMYNERFKTQSRVLSRKGVPDYGVPC